MSFFEEWIKKTIVFNTEISNIENLLKKHYCYPKSIYGDIRANFLNWKLRQTSISFESFLLNSGIQDIINKANDNIEISLIEFLRYIEYVNAILRFWCSSNPFYRCDNENFIAVNQNIDIILDKINFDLKWIGNDDSAYAICIEKDFKARYAAEAVNDSNISEQIFLFNHHSLKGNLFDKAIILSRLYMVLEGIKTNLTSNNLGYICQELGHLSDKMNVRHKPKGKEVLVVNNMTEEEIEKIYDRMFKTYLIAIILDDYLKNDKVFLESVRAKFSVN